MKRAVQSIVQSLFYSACIGVALIICALPSLFTGPF